MKIGFAKVRYLDIPFEIKDERFHFLGTISSAKKNLVKIVSTLELNVTVQCDRCGVEIEKKNKEEFNCLVSDGVFEGFDTKNDVIESFDGFIDLDEIAESEIHSIQSDYNYCQTCQNKGE